MKLYFDTCCYNRPFDDLSQERVRQESDAVLSIIARARLCNAGIFGSAALIGEIVSIQNEERRNKVALLYRITTQFVERDEAVVKRAKELQGKGMHAMDSMHVALSEKVDAVFLTVDDKLLRICKRLGINAMSPTEYLGR